MEKLYRIAGLTVKMNTFGRTECQSVPYRISEESKPDIVLDTSIFNVAELLPDFSDEMREYILTGSLFYRHLLDFDGLMLHSSAVVVDERAYLFTAHSGTGKSTHTQLWLDLFGDRAYILNDDKPALRLENGTWYAYGTPWSGKHDISLNKKVPLAGIAFIERGSENIITKFSGKTVVSEIMKQVNRPGVAEYRVKLLKNVDALLAQVPIWRLKCNMDPEAAIVSYEAMSGQKFEQEM